MSELALPAAALWNLSIAAASAYGSPAEIAADRSPDGFGTSPTRITCAPPIAPEPVGASEERPSAVAVGSDVGPESRIGALIGAAISTEEAIAACQSPVGASVTTWGCVPAPLEG